MVDLTVVKLFVTKSLPAKQLPGPGAMYKKRKEDKQMYHTSKATLNENMASRSLPPLKKKDRTVEFKLILN